MQHNIKTKTYCESLLITSTNVMLIAQNTIDTNLAKIYQNFGQNNENTLHIEINNATVNLAICIIWK